MDGKDKPDGGFREQTGLAAKLRCTVAFALDKRGDSFIVGTDDLAMREPLALGEPSRLGLDAVVVLKSRLQLALQALSLGLVDLGGQLEMMVGLLGPLGQGLAQSKQMGFGLSHQFDKHFALSSTLASKATHGLFEAAPKDTTLGLEHTRGLRDGIGDAIDHVEDFLWALYKVVASVTRWLPCSAGKVSIRTWAGLTSPSSIAAAA